MSSEVRAWLESHNFPQTIDLGGIELDAATFLLVTGVAVLLLVLRPSVAVSEGAEKSRATNEVLTKDRRSVVLYSGPAPEHIIHQALQAAIRAPNHFLTEPWRFRMLGEASRNGLASMNESKRNIFKQTPHMMLVTMHWGENSTLEWNKKSLEDHCAVSCAIQNFMLSLASEGIGSKWMTGALGIDPSAILDLCNVSEDQEHFMGVIFFGMPRKPMSQMSVPKRKLGLGEPIVQHVE